MTNLKEKNKLQFIKIKNGNTLKDTESQRRREKEGGKDRGRERESIKEKKTRK